MICKNASWYDGKNNEEVAEIEKESFLGFVSKDATKQVKSFFGNTNSSNT